MSRGLSNTLVALAVLTAIFIILFTLAPRVYGASPCSMDRSRTTETGEKIVSCRKRQSKKLGWTFDASWTHT